MKKQNDSEKASDWPKPTQGGDFVLNPAEFQPRVSLTCHTVTPKLRPPSYPVSIRETMPRETENMCLPCPYPIPGHHPRVWTDRMQREEDQAGRQEPAWDCSLPSPSQWALGRGGH